MYMCLSCFRQSRRNTLQLKPPLPIVSFDLVAYTAFVELNLSQNSYMGQANFAMYKINWKSGKASEP